MPHLRPARLTHTAGIGVDRMGSLADASGRDGLLPWANHLLPPGASLAAQLRRFWTAGGVDHVSLTAGAGSEGPIEPKCPLSAYR